MIELSQNELQRVKVIQDAVGGRITVVQASELRQVSLRQVKRLKSCYCPDTVEWVRHGNRGGEKPWRLPDPVRAQIVQLATEKYRGFNDSHLTQKLVSEEGLEMSRETVRRVLRGAGLKSPQKRRPQKYRGRENRAWA